jgi:16S rRNA processing protein RimM
VAAAELLEVGTVARAHGIRGDVVVSLVTNRLERVAPGSRLVARSPSGEDRELEVVASRPHLARHIVTFEGVASREEADALRGRMLYAPPIPGTGGDFYVHELIGAEVVDTAGVRRGVVTGIEANPASDLLVVEGRWYVPLRFVVEQRPAQVVIDPPVGLFE